MTTDVETAGQAAVAGAPALLTQGTSIAGGRFTIAAHLRSSSFGEVYRASDSSGDPVTLYRLRDDLVADAAAAARVAQLVQAVSAIEHKNLAHTQELLEETTGRFIVGDYADGNPLADLIARKREASTAFSPKGAYNVMAHVCNALDHVHGQRGAHGALHTGNVIVTKAGRVKVAELGIGALYSRTLARSAAAVFIAPDVLGGGKVTPPADIFSCGVILYELLTGARPGQGSPPPSQANPNLPAEVDRVVARCTAPDPGQRFASAGELKAALSGALGLNSGGVSTQTAAVEPAATAARRPSLAHQLSSTQQAHLAAVTPTSPSAQMNGALADDEERFLINKGSLDYGPFSFAQIVQMIETHEIVPGNDIVDKDTGDRCNVEEHPLLAPLVDKAKHHRDEMRRAQAEVAHAKSEKRRGATLYLFIAAGAIALCFGVYGAVSALSTAKDSDDVTLASLEESELQMAITFPSASEKKKRRARRRTTNKGQRGGAAGLDDFDGAMDLGDASEGGGSERLDDSQINPVIQRHGGKLGRCLQSGGSRQANIQFIVKGSTGRVSAVKVNGQQSGGLHGCIARAMKSMQFPKFNGVRTRAEFDIGF